LKLKLLVNFSSGFGRETDYFQRHSLRSLAAFQYLTRASMLGILLSSAPAKAKLISN